ncbi:SPASM domain-containing protein [Chloracidobacterium sp. MS 40/45]|jgi:hypothetical protein|uniref:radical SAM/SPASM domain-containing protein n=1 Tax=Chloracidobacterium TaxID=458032 RepID=UPI0007C84931|nr:MULTISPECIES: radical SAM/SPASM domain-containing protein [Chloracidobacterium]QUW01277.1 SPASM domain-containing protein [Chloracidobacterium sp. MS 40/45]
MESIYFVLSWPCHRQCPHCYDDRFHPYQGEEMKSLVAESARNIERLVANLPQHMRYFDLHDPDEQGRPREKVGRIILAGGEVLLPAVREQVLYPAMEAIHRKYATEGGVHIVVQTTGDLLTWSLIDALVARHVSCLLISGVDSFHKGLETKAAQLGFVTRLTMLLETRGVRKLALEDARRGHLTPQGRPTYLFFGAQPDLWIGKLWPRGRAMVNELSTARLCDNFCNQLSGGVGFLQPNFQGSEVSIEPNGNVYPCCLKTRLAIGNLLEEPLDAILDRLQGDPVYEAISMGHPERMGIRHGWSVETFVEKSQMRLPSGATYRNFCIGCDRFHEEVLIPLRRSGRPE